MGIKSIGGNTLTAPLAKTNDAAQKTDFNGSTQNRANVRAIGFMLEQLAGEVAESAGSQPSGDLKQEAKKLIERHTSAGWLGFPSLDNTGLGKELAEKSGECPELAAAVFEQLKSGGKLYTGQAMLEHLTDKQLAEIGTSAQGRQVLSVIKESLAANIEYQKSWGEFLTPTKKVAADEHRIQRIDRAISEGAKTEKTNKTQKAEVANNSIEFQEISEDQLLKIAPTLKKNPAKLKAMTENLNQTMRKFEINTPLKQSMFLATVAEESGEFKFMEELPSKYASSKSKYKGRGILQITHEENYRAFGEYIGKGDLFVKQPELLATEEYATLSAGWFWSVKNSGQYNETPNSRIGSEPKADLMDFREAAGLVNGGQRDRFINHWGTRLEYYQRALKSLDIPVNEEMQKSLKDQIQKYQGKNHLRRPEQSWWDSPAGKREIERKGK